MIGLSPEGETAAGWKSLRFVTLNNRVVAAAVGGHPVKGGGDAAVGGHAVWVRVAAVGSRSSS